MKALEFPAVIPAHAGIPPVLDSASRGLSPACPSKGFGFVEMASEAEAAKALNALHDSEFEGRNIVVSEANDRLSQDL